MKNERELSFPIQIGTGYFRKLGMTREEARYHSQRSLESSVTRISGGQSLQEVREGIILERTNRLAVTDQRLQEKENEN